MLNPEPSDGRGACTEDSEVTLKEVLFDYIRFVLLFYQDASALSAGHSAQTSPEPAEGELPFAMIRTYQVAKRIQKEENKLLTSITTFDIILSIIINYIMIFNKSKETTSCLQHKIQNYPG
jgi:hypothetical protein